VNKYEHMILFGILNIGGAFTQNIFMLLLGLVKIVIEIW